MVDGPKAKIIVSNELLVMVDVCIDLACKLREDVYRIHVSDTSKKAPNKAATSEASKATCFSEIMRSKLEILQFALRETTENISDF